MNIDSMERHLPSKITRHHRHPRYPEEDNVKTCNKNTSRIESFKILCLLWPAQGREWP